MNNKAFFILEKLIVENDIPKIDWKSKEFLKRVSAKIDEIYSKDPQYQKRDGFGQKPGRHWLVSPRDRQLFQDAKYKAEIAVENEMLDELSKAKNNIKVTSTATKIKSTKPSSTQIVKTTPQITNTPNIKSTNNKMGKYLLVAGITGLTLYGLYKMLRRKGKSKYEAAKAVESEAIKTGNKSEIIKWKNKSKRYNK